MSFWAMYSCVRGCVSGHAVGRGHHHAVAELEAWARSAGWATEGNRAITPGDETDFDRIEGDILELCRRLSGGERRLRPLAIDADGAATAGRGGQHAGVPGDNAELQPGDP